MKNGEVPKKTGTSSGKSAGGTGKAATSAGRTIGSTTKPAGTTSKTGETSKKRFGLKAKPPPPAPRQPRARQRLSVTVLGPSGAEHALPEGGMLSDLQASEPGTATSTLAVPVDLSWPPPAGDDTADAGRLDLSWPSPGNTDTAAPTVPEPISDRPSPADDTAAILEAQLDLTWPAPAAAAPSTPAERLRRTTKPAPKPVDADSKATSAASAAVEESFPERDVWPDVNQLDIPFELRLTPPPRTPALPRLEVPLDFGSSTAPIETASIEPARLEIPLDLSPTPPIPEVIADPAGVEVPLPLIRTPPELHETARPAARQDRATARQTPIIAAPVSAAPDAPEPVSPPQKPRRTAAVTPRTAPPIAETPAKVAMAGASTIATGVTPAARQRARNSTQPAVAPPTPTAIAPAPAVATPPAQPAARNRTQPAVAPATPAPTATAPAPAVATPEVAPKRPARATTTRKPAPAVPDAPVEHARVDIEAPPLAQPRRRVVSQATTRTHTAVAAPVHETTRDSVVEPPAQTRTQPMTQVPVSESATRPPTDTTPDTVTTAQEPVVIDPHGSAPAATPAQRRTRRVPRQAAPQPGTPLTDEDAVAGTPALVAPAEHAPSAPTAEGRTAAAQSVVTSHPIEETQPDPRASEPPVAAAVPVDPPHDPADPIDAPGWPSFGEFSRPSTAAGASVQAASAPEPSTDDGFRPYRAVYERDILRAADEATSRAAAEQLEREAAWDRAGSEVDLPAPVPVSARAHMILSAGAPDPQPTIVEAAVASPAPAKSDASAQAVPDGPAGAAPMVFDVGTGSRERDHEGLEARLEVAERELRSLERRTNRDDGDLRNARRRELAEAAREVLEDGALAPHFDLLLGNGRFEFHRRGPGLSSDATPIRRVAGDIDVAADEPAVPEGPQIRPRKTARADLRELEI